MSFMRAGSNPESLYVVGTGEFIEFYWVDEKDNHLDAKCPHDDLFDLVRKVIKIEEAAYDLEEKPAISGSLMVKMENIKGQFKFVLSFEGYDHPLIMHDVTWDALKNNVIWRLERSTGWSRLWRRLLTFWTIHFCR